MEVHIHSQTLVRVPRLDVFIRFFLWSLGNPVEEKDKVFYEQDGLRTLQKHCLRNHLSRFTETEVGIMEPAAVSIRFTAYIMVVDFGFLCGF